jgi:hypothetical protein
MKNQNLAKSLTLGLGLFAATLTQAQTYNFYFNNGEGAQNAPGAPAMQQPVTPAPVAPQVPPPAIDDNISSGPVTPPVVVPKSEIQYHDDSKEWSAKSSASLTQKKSATNYDNDSDIKSVSIRIGGSRIKEDGLGYYVNGDYFADGGDSVGASLSVTKNILSYMAVTGFAGTASESDFFAGLEGEVIPVRLDLFGYENKIEVAGILGVSSMAAAPGNFLTAHVGARVGFNFNDGNWTLNTLVRGNAGFAMAEVGLGYNF